MLKLLFGKIKESAMSILPITMIVVLFSFTPFLNLSRAEMIVFIISSVLLILGMGLFNLGATISMTPMGEYAGVGLVKMGKLWLIILVTFIMGFLVTIAEPDLMVLAEQVTGVIDKNNLIVFVGIGVAISLVFAILKMIAHKQLSQILMILYMLLFALVTIVYDQGKINLLPLSFDSGGVTTGPITVPFIMAFGFGIASTIGGKDINENSFGMVALSSVGPILVVLLLSLMAKGDMNYVLPIYSIDETLMKPLNEIIAFVSIYFLGNLMDVSKSLMLIFMFFIIMQVTILKLPKTKMLQIIIGIFITIIGLAIFLTIVSVGFLPIGQSIGLQMATIDKRIVIVFAFIVGMTVVLAEPAVHVLNEQVEEVTAGAVTKRSMMTALSIGVGISLVLSLVRVMYGFSILYYLVPGYFLSLALSIFVPPIYTSIAFDSGGVASGPMASTFILPLVIGFCSVHSGDDSVLGLAFGAVSLIAMTPLITIQLLGFKSVTAHFFKNRRVMKKILSAADNQIIYFDIEY